MTTSIAWPTSLPDFLLLPYGVTPRTANVEAASQMLAPSALVYTLSGELVACQLVVTAAQEQALRTFFRTGTAMGTQSFLVSILVSGARETREAQFHGAPPAYVPLSPALTQATFTLLTWPGQVDPVTPVYELSATYAINLDALDFGDTPPFGITQTITTLASDKLVIRKPSVVADPELTWDAWSPWASDGANPPGTGLTWINDFEMYDEANASLLAYVTSRLIDVTAALAYAQADMPMEFTGHTAYRIGHYDPAPGDNRAGLSLRVEVYSLV